VFQVTGKKPAMAVQLVACAHNGVDIGCGKVPRTCLTVGCCIHLVRSAQHQLGLPQRLPQAVKLLLVLG
jgi:hypothetical protein